VRTDARLLVDSLAVYRLTRLATADAITQPLRDRIIEAAYTSQGRAEQHRQRWLQQAGGMVEGDWQRIVDVDDQPPKLATLVSCSHCVSVYVAAAVVLVARRSRWWPAVSDALALSAVAALLTRLE
jgi:hypothetical protein